jgi:glycosyltransferase involved in cell wall biosynthesis
MKVSVCMITYLHEKFIEQAINSVLMQECNFDIELVIVNDCSPDSTDEIILNIIQNHPRGSWIKYIKHSENIGMMPNFIFALKNCSGKYVALCEGDDYWLSPMKLKKQIEFLEENSTYVLCFHRVDILKINGDIVNDFITKVPENYEVLETLARLGNYIHTPSVVFRNIIKEFPFEFELTPIGDYFLYMMLAEYGKIKCFQEKMAIYRYGVGVFSSNSKLEMAKSNLKTCTCLISYLKDEKIKKIILERQFLAVNILEKDLVNQYKTFFISSHIFFRTLMFIQNNYKHPKKIVKKVLFKVVN